MALEGTLKACDLLSAVKKRKRNEKWDGQMQGAHECLTAFELYRIKIMANSSVTKMFVR